MGVQGVTARWGSAWLVLLCGVACSTYDERLQDVQSESGG